MKIRKQQAFISHLEYKGIPDDSLFLDIETTGLSPDRAFIYMISTVSVKDGDISFTNIMAENASEEAELLDKTISIIREHDTLIHYNGDKFDLPFITKRCRAYGLDPGMDAHDSIDIYKHARALKDILGLSGCKQKDIEKFLGVDREDIYSGKELISVYSEYSRTHSDELYDLLYQHNHDDVLGMLRILPILAFEDLFNGAFDITDTRRGSYIAANGKEAEEIIISLVLNSPLPTSMCINDQGIYLVAKGNTATLKLPVLNSELRFFYDDPKDYYYLPLEDMAVHKSLAQYVDKDHRIRAKAENCYTKKTGTFLPEWSPIYTPVFRTSYDSDTLYFELPESPVSKEYIDHIIKHLQIHKH